MLLRFTIENYRCIHDESQLSMIATRERRHSNRLATWQRHRVLPVAAIYGANASGKSTYVSALHALQALILTPRAASNPIPVVPHLGLGKEQPTRFQIEILVQNGSQESAFTYEIQTFHNTITYEALHRIGRTHDTCLFERSTGHEIEIYDANLLADEWAVMRAKSVEDSLTVLGVVGYKIDGPVNAVWSWFAQQLHIITPGAEYVQLPARIKLDDVFAGAMNRALSSTDTGITQLTLREVALDYFGRSRDVLNQYHQQLATQGGSIVIPTIQSGPGLLELDDAGNLCGRILIAQHGGGPGSPFSLMLDDESDGTRRFMNLLPILTQLEDSDNDIPARKVFIVDELENSLHPHLTERILTDFLNTCDQSTRRQLIFTTHEVTLLRTNIFRRDEMWIADKARSLCSIADFSGIGARKDSDIFSMYMSGRLGGVPREQ